MPELPTYFTDFLANIRLGREGRDELKSGHSELRERLENDPGLADIFVSTLLQGSYRRATMVRPAEGCKADVDVILVTRLDRSVYSPHQALERFRDFLEQHYRGQWTFQGRSIGIELKSVALDLVVTSAPSEVEQKALRSASALSEATLEDAPDWRFNNYWVPPERQNLPESTYLMRKAAEEPEWRSEPLWIPDRDAREWQQTNPLGQLLWTSEKNKNTNRHFINVVKALKWWRRVRCAGAKHPKSYPLERIIGECCPDGIGSVALGVTQALEAIVSRFADDVLFSRTPNLPDHGIEQNVLQRVTPADFAAFHAAARTAAGLARAALDEKEIPKGVELWRELFGEEFPPPGEGGKGESGGGPGVLGGGFSRREGQTDPEPERFA